MLSLFHPTCFITVPAFSGTVVLLCSYRLLRFGRGAVSLTDFVSGCQTRVSIMAFRSTRLHLYHAVAVAARYLEFKVRRQIWGRGVTWYRISRTRGKSKNKRIKVLNIWFLEPFFICHAFNLASGYISPSSKLT